MGKTNHNPLLTGVRGRIGDLVIKQYKEGTVITMMPSYTKRKPTRRQKEHRAVFAAAVKYAKAEQLKHILKYGNAGRKESKLIYFAALKAFIAEGTAARWRGEKADPKKIPHFEIIKGRAQIIEEKEIITLRSPVSATNKKVKKAKPAAKVKVKKKK